MRPLIAALCAATLAFAAAGCADDTPAATSQPDRADAPDEGTEDDTSDTSNESADAPDVSGDLVVHFLNVGQGDASLLVHDDVTLLIDAGRHDRSDVTEHLDRLGVTHLDVLALTHPHADHIGQADRILTDLTVEEVWASGATHSTRTFERYIDALDASDATYDEPRARDTTTVGPLTIDIIGPDDDANFADVHDSGLSFRITYGNVRFVFTGDAETATEARYVDRHADLLDGDILQLGHHGSATSTTQPFLDAVAPAVAIYSAGAGNTYGHPHDVVIDRVTTFGADLYGTDVNGTVTVTTDGTSWTATPEREGTPAGNPSTDDHDHDDHDDHDHEAAPSGCEPDQIDINNADADELTTIDHIGTSRANDLIDGRPYTSLDQLERVDGIGPGRLADIHEQGLACAG